MARRRPSLSVSESFEDPTERGEGRTISTKSNVPRPSARTPASSGPMKPHNVRMASSASDAPPPSATQSRPRIPTSRKSFSRPRTPPKSAALQDGHPTPNPGAAQPMGAVTPVPPKSPMPPPKGLRTATIRRMASTPVMNDSPIGMAIGSPTHDIPFYRRMNTSDTISSRMPQKPSRVLSRPEEYVHPEQAWTGAQQKETRKKVSGWKSLGSMFGRKLGKSQSSSPFVQSRNDSEQSLPSFLSPDVPSAGFARNPPFERHARIYPSPHHQKGYSLHSPMPGSAPIAARPHRQPIPNQRDSVRPAHTPLIVPDEKHLETDEGSAKDSAYGSPLSNSDKQKDLPGPRLDLAIPNPRMDRYSVMFETVLSERQPSILERRRSRMKSMSTHTLKSTSSASEDGSTSDLDTTSRTSSSSKHARSIRSNKRDSFIPDLSIRISKLPQPPAKTGNQTAFRRPQTATRSMTDPLQSSRTLKPETLATPKSHDTEDQTSPYPPPLDITKPSRSSSAKRSSTKISAIPVPLPKRPLAATTSPIVPTPQLTFNDQSHLPPKSSQKSSQDPSSDTARKQTTSKHPAQADLVQVAIARSASLSRARRAVNEVNNGTATFPNNSSNSGTLGVNRPSVVRTAAVAMRPRVVKVGSGAPAVRGGGLRTGSGGMLDANSREEQGALRKSTVGIIEGERV